MKFEIKYLVVIFIVFINSIWISLSLLAQIPLDSTLIKNKIAYTNIVKIDFISPVGGVLAVYYEHCLGDNSSGQLELRILNGGVILTPELRFYVSDSNAPEGIYIAPWIRFGDGLSSLRKKASFGGGILVGAQTIKKRISFDAFIGPAIYGGPDIRTLTIVRAGLVLGYAF